MRHHPLSAPFRAQFLRDVMMFFKIGFQFWRGFHVLRGTERAITIFGSARLPDNHHYCDEARNVAAYIASQGIAVITGGGPSVMQAANQGAHEAGGESIGINIHIPREQKINPFVTSGYKFYYFFVRKVLLCRYSEAFIIFPGGFGTLDEFFELITLIQTNRMIERPIVLVGREYWQGLLDWMKNTLLKAGTINQKEFDRIVVYDTAEEVITNVLKKLGSA